MKTGNLVVVLPNLSSDHRKQIAESAEAKGFKVAFFDSVAESLPALAESEIILGQAAELAQNAPKLEWICTPSAGVNQFVGEGIFAAPGAILTNSSGAYGVTISEHVIMVLLEILRRQHEYQAHIAKREWVRRLPVRSIFGSRITLLGTGDIGQETLYRLRSFAPESITGVNRSGRNPDDLFDRIVRSDRLDTVLPETDILIISLPGTKETFHIIGETQLKQLPDRAVIINVGRGAVLDQAALEKELRSGRLYAGLDVFETEPVPPDSTLWDCPRLVITPHVAGDTTLPHTMDRIIDLFLEDLENYCTGRPLKRLVDRSLGY